jgi:hypothetical protein
LYIYIYIYGVPDRVKQGFTQSGTPYTQTDGNNIRPHTAQIYNERTSTDLNLVNA